MPVESNQAHVHNQYFVLGDWGTSVSRFYLCCPSPTGNNFDVLETRLGEGVKLIDDVKRYFQDQLSDWLGDYQPRLAVLSGMVGSNIGWQAIPYLPLPSSLGDLAKASVAVNNQPVRIKLVPGLECINSLGHWDVMRGEEVQIFGALGIDSNLGHEKNSLICIPGTHSKWVQVQRGTIKRFLTGLSGELFHLLKQHSILLTEPPPQLPVSEAQWAQFTRAVQSVKAGESALLHRLFSVRSLQLKQHLSLAEAPYYLSGLILATDIKDALTIHQKSNANIDSITLIASEDLLPYYKTAFDIFSIKVHVINAQDATLAGLYQIYHAITKSEKIEETAL